LLHCLPLPSVPRGPSVRLDFPSVHVGAGPERHVEDGASQRSISHAADAMTVPHETETVDEAHPPFAPFPREALEGSLVARFRTRVVAWPDRPAVRAGGVSVSYRELAERAAGVARELVSELGDRPEPVALLLPQGVELVAAILGVLSAGKLYLGLDAAFPPALLEDMVADSGARVVLSSSALADAAARAAAGAADVWPLDTRDPTDATRAPALPEIEPDRPAYLFYTSGSTGRPKGVVDSHRNVLHNVMRYTNSLRIGPADRMTLLQSAGFSGSVSSLFGALMNGACSLPLDPHVTSSAGLARWIAEERVTIYHSVPALFRSAFAHGGSFPDLRVVRLEGDQAAKADVRLFAARARPDAVLVNGLGTTETGLVRQFFVSPSEEPAGAVLPVGYPVPDMEVTVVDEDGVRVPDGAVGEIAVTSRYLAVGYWRDPERTALRFRPDPADPSMRTYRTGDLGRMRPDGCLEHLGRMGSRVKVRGHTVELAEVELALLDQPTVAAAAVVLDERDGAPPRLLAYWVPAPGAAPTTIALRASMAERVAPHMLPALFIELAALPLTVNGKVDRGALPPPGRERPRRGPAYVEPRSPLERHLASIWEELLSISPVGVHDDFVELGGDSLSAMILLTRIESELDVEPSPDWILSESTVAGLAERILADHLSSPRQLVTIQEGAGGAPLLYLHGDYTGTGYYSLGLARAMGPEVPFVAVTPSGRDGGEPAPSYEEMARRHLEAIRAFQPRGPYHLGGTCNGGLVAFEIARLLVQEGEEVPTLVLFAASARNLRFRALRRACDLVTGLLRRDPAAGGVLFGVLRDGLRRVARGVEIRGTAGFVRHALARLFSSPVDLVSGSVVERVGAPAQEGASTLYTHYHRIDDEYMPRRYPGKVTLLWPNDEPETAPEALSWWRRVAPDVELREVAAEHQACVTTHVPVLGRALADVWAERSGPSARGSGPSASPETEVKDAAGARADQPPVPGHPGE